MWVEPEVMACASVAKAAEVDSHTVTMREHCSSMLMRRGSRLAAPIRELTCAPARDALAPPRVGSMNPRILVPEVAVSTQ